MRKYTRFSKKSSHSNKINWKFDSDVKNNVNKLLKELNFENFDKNRIYCLSSENANTRAIARIYGLSRVWQKVLKQKPAYVIEVITEKYEHLPEKEKRNVLLHELAHIPKNFSGSLVPHIRRGRRSFYKKLKMLIDNIEKME